MDRETVTIIARHALFRRLSQTEKSGFVRHVREEETGSNGLIFREGTAGDSLYVVIRGSVLLQRELEGEPVPALTLQPGESFGELALLLPGNRMITAKAIAPTLLARISHSDLEAYEEQHPAAANLIRAKIINHFLLKVRHLLPLWEQLAATGLRALDRA